MRNHARIYSFCNRLAAAWSCMPDWRFGQFIINVFSEFVSQTGKDPFFPEEDEMIEFIENYCGINTSSRSKGGSNGTL